VRRRFGTRALPVTLAVLVGVLLGIGLVTAP
jgi:hypothetical protein